MDKRKKLEHKVKNVLTEGEMKGADPEKAALEKLPQKYEIRVQTMMDPIVEETAKVREYAEEIDDRYDHYLEKTKQKNKE